MIMDNNLGRERLKSIQCEVKELVNVFKTIEPQLANRLPGAEREEVPNVLLRLQSFEKQLSTDLEDLRRRERWLIWVPLIRIPPEPFSPYFWRRLFFG